MSFSPIMYISSSLLIASLTAAQYKLPHRYKPSTVIGNLFRRFCSTPDFGNPVVATIVGRISILTAENDKLKKANAEIIEKLAANNDEISKLKEMLYSSDTVRNANELVVRSILPAVKKGKTQQALRLPQETTSADPLTKLALKVHDDLMEFKYPGGDDVVEENWKINKNSHRIQCLQLVLSNYPGKENEILRKLVEIDNALAKELGVI